MDRVSGDGRLAGDLEYANNPVSRSCELGDVSFGALLDVDGSPRVQWATPDGLELVGCGVTAAFTATGTDRLERIRSRANAFFDSLEHDGPRESRPRAFGGLSFHDGHEPTTPWEGYDAASFVVPRIQVTRTERGTWLTTVAEDEAAAADALERWRASVADLPAMLPSGTGPGIVATRRPTSRDAWTGQVETALERIGEGTIEKVVLAQTLEVDLESAIDIAATLERLRRRYPNCYRFLIDREHGGTFFGAPPERLVAMDGGDVVTEALAGSVPRGETPEEDEALVDRMRESDKFQREHGLVVEAIRDQLEPLSSSVTVGEQTIRRLATIQHLQTPIEARIDGDGTDVHVLEVVEALHPTPAVGGLPPEPAWETIRDIETFERGWYAAPVGWFDGSGDGEFAVGIRSGLATDRHVTLFSGNGIVADSDPDDEWAEIQLKFRPILDELR